MAHHSRFRCRSLPKLSRTSTEASVMGQPARLRVSRFLSCASSFKPWSLMLQRVMWSSRRRVRPRRCRVSLFLRWMHQPRLSTSRSVKWARFSRPCCSSLHMLSESSLRRVMPRRKPSPVSPTQSQASRLSVRRLVRCLSSSRPSRVMLKQQSRARLWSLRHWEPSRRRPASVSWRQWEICRMRSPGEQSDRSQSSVTPGWEASRARSMLRPSKSEMVVESRRCCSSRSSKIFWMRSFGMRSSVRASKCSSDLAKCAMQQSSSLGTSPSKHLSSESMESRRALKLSGTPSTPSRRRLPWRSAWPSLPLKPASSELRLDRM
mmetsp:Transcript_35562/g.77327  ORF Transcript_35562/g.77327 Transcript_35562/m.77327 type:complete len:320 (+) Transcript_35562:214-1173(+)